MTTPAVLGERALRRLGVEVVSVADRPALSTTISVTAIAERALQGLGVPVAAAGRPPLATVIPVVEIAVRALQALGVTVAEADRPTLTTVVTVTAIAERALQALGATVTLANRPAFTATITTAAIATGALIELGVIASDETPSTTDQALALAKVLEVHDALVAQGAVAWASTAILQAAAEEYIKLTALIMATSFGKTGDPAQWPMLEARVKRVSMLAQSQALAEARVNAIHDELVRNAAASWASTAIPQGVSDDYVALAIQQMAPLFGAQAPGADATAVIEARVKRVALVLQGQSLAEERVATVHDALVGNGYASWAVAAIPQAVADDYVTLVRFELAPVFAVDLQAPAGLIPAIEARVKRYALVLQAQALAEARVAAIHDELVGSAHVSWASTAIPQAVSDDYVSLAMIKLAPLFEIKADPAGVPVFEARVRHFSLVQRAPDLATEAVTAVHADLAARGMVRWTIQDLPLAGEQPYVLLAAFKLAPEFEVRPDPNDYIVAEKSIARMIALPTSGERVRTEDFLGPSMTTFAMTVPVARGPVHLSRRDLALDGAEDVALQFTVIGSDRSDGVAVDLNDPAGSALTVNVWYRAWAWDYGWPVYAWYGGGLLWSGAGTILPGPPDGRVDVLIPAGTVATWCGHLAWTAQLTYAAGLTSTILRGALSVHV